MGQFMVAGPRRTGTSLLTSVCCSDPSANPMLAEAQILTRVVEAYRWGRLHFQLFGKSYFDDTEAYRRHFAEMAASFVRHVQERFAPISHVVLKNPEFSLVIDDLCDLLPEAKVIVCIRDPRDQVVSEYETGLRQLKAGMTNDAVKNRDMAALARMYCVYGDPLMLAAAREPQRFLFVRFEDLMSRTEQTLDALRAFTGMAFSAFDRDADWARMRVDLNDYEGVPTMTPQVGRKFDPSRIGRFRAVLRDFEIETIHSVCRPYFERFGYDMAIPREASAERAPNALADPS